MAKKRRKRRYTHGTITVHATSKRNAANQLDRILEMYGGEIAPITPGKLVRRNWGFDWGF